MLDLFLRRWALISLIGVLGTALSVFWIWKSPREYESVATIFTKSLFTVPGAMGDLARTFGGDSASSEEDFIKALLDSSTVRLNTYDKLKLDSSKPFWGQYKVGGKVDKLQKLENMVKVVARQGVIQIRVRSQDSQMSCDLAATLLEITTQTLLDNNHRLTDVFDGKIKMAKEKLALAEKQVSSFQNRNGVMPDPKEFAKSEYGLYHDLVGQMAKAEIMRNELTERLDSCGTLELQLELSNELAGAISRCDTLQKKIFAEEDKLKSRSSLAVTQLRLLREVAWQEKILQVTIEQREQVRLKQATREKPFVVVDKPFVADKPMARKALTKVAAAMAVFFTLGFAMASALDLISEFRKSRKMAANAA
jgi:uncharacterized protein involved in exopolysaccharide biosynthesis